MVESDIKSTLEAKLKEFKELATFKENGWAFEEKEKNLNIYKRVVKGAPQPMMGSSTTVSIEPKKLLSVLLNDAYMLEIDDSKVARKTFKTEKIDDSSSLHYIYQKGKGKLMVDPRDTVTCALVVETADEVLMVATSVEDKDHPPVKGTVRAEVLMQAWRLTRNGANTDVAFLIQFDPKGSIPSAMVSAGMKKAVGMIDKVVDYINKKKLWRIILPGQ